jgi:hypothetical protein
MSFADTKHLTLLKRLDIVWLNRIINHRCQGKRGMEIEGPKVLENAADTALRLARYFKMSPQFWLALRMDHELHMAEDSLEGKLKKEVKPMSAI